LQGRFGAGWADVVGGSARCSAGDVAHHVLAGDIAALLLHDLARPLGHGPTQVHAFRVATRRLRSDLHTFRLLLDPGWVDVQRTRLQPVGVMVAPIRHIDVFLGFLDRAVEGHPAAEGEAPSLAAQFLDLRAEAHHRLVDTLRAPWYCELLDELALAATDLFVDQHPLADSRQPAMDILPSLLRRPWRQLREAARAVEAGQGEPALDNLRVCARRCRYTAEATIPVLGDPARRLADSAAALHAALGDLSEVALCLRWLDHPPAGLRIAFHVQRSMARVLRQVAVDADHAWPWALEAVLDAKAATMTPETTRSVAGAGGVVWRGDSRVIEVVLVHRRKHDDWSLPKGNAHPGESSDACALREVKEETGLSCRLGRELPSTAYRNQDGRRKVVRYWAMTPASGTLSPTAEVDDARWLPVPEAIRTVKRGRDTTVLKALLRSPRTAFLPSGGAG
jgi:CHAD domain-containing protein/8-oxo-dGTP pyrophosphatase MutT (NUDIX family)